MVPIEDMDTAESFPSIEETMGSGLPRNPRKDEQTCHMLPCSIDYQGMASTHVYFRPIDVDGVVSSTFRGRGLLALSPPSDKTTGAFLLSIQNQQLQVKVEMDHILDWHQEHNPETLFLESTASRVQVANDWSEVALALHEPIPLEDEVPVA